MTLNKTWKLCLRMWKWISEEWAKELNTKSPETLKRQWLQDNGFDFREIYLECFFCEWHNRHREPACGNCPGKLVDHSFSCTLHAGYSYNDEPVAFYKELLRLNRIRKGKK